MRDEGLQHIFERHERLARYTREGLADLDLRLLADPHFASPTVTTAYLPEGVNGKALLSALREHHGVVLAGGQGELSGKIFRIGHMGWIEQADLDAVLHALQAELNSARAAPAVR
jgi:aspartate aminotransferase-like enzyme